MTELAAQFALFLAVLYGVAFVVRPLLGYRFAGSWPRFSGLLLLFTPCLIDRDNVKLRALACVLAGDLAFKLVDYARESRALPIEDRRLATFARFLVPFPIFLVQVRQRVSRTNCDFSRLPGLAIAVVVFTGCIAVTVMLSHVESVRTSFLLDQTLKVSLFAIACDALGRIIHAVEQISGFPTRPLIDDALLSRSVGEFWYRYNTRVHSWLEHNVFRPCGGRRSPIRGLFLTFFVSAVFHEVAFGVATGRFDGYQFAFFMLQAPAVVASRPLERFARSSRMGRILSRSLTVLWFWATSMLFLYGVNRIFPLVYRAEPWLP